MSAIVALLAAAVLCWPPAGVGRRLRGVLARQRSRRLPRIRRRPTLPAVAGLAALAGWAVSGPAGGIAAGLAAATAWRRWTARRAIRQNLAAADGLAEALGSVVAGLRAGIHPAAATESAATDAEPRTAQALRAIGAAARLDGDVRLALASSRAATPATAQALTQLGGAWLLVKRHGLPLAELLDAVRVDLHTRVRFARQVLARMAGPRASATILALLPVLGIALGHAMGARPLHVLTATPTGQLLLLLGTGLTCAGIAWSARLTDKVVLR
ncbi:type II secretion system F family protein [Actinophytocola sp.]|uniref:type II secretion system F family protein n=1 Tax=Actinophytocola sp. TaxID=1872138 RepID=UPI002DB95CEB|nr:type II secretion system F family protein [Actinophytocola sp.]